ncbi:MAG: diphthamide biosynthesis methyltransferase, partial [Patescibacteria group bacterium]
YYKENKSINAHTLLLTDIDLELSKAIEQLQTACNSEGCQIKKLIVISHAGLDDQAIYYEKIKTFEHKTVPMPFCIIIPAEMHHIEEDALNAIKENIDSDK